MHALQVRNVQAVPAWQAFNVQADPMHALTVKLKPLCLEALVVEAVVQMEPMFVEAVDEIRLSMLHQLHQYIELIAK